LAISSPNDRERLTALLARCYHDFDLFNSAILGRPAYWPRQRELVQSVAKYGTTVAYTGNSIGKDYAVAGLILAWLCTRYDSQVIVTAPSQTLLGSVTWKEVRRAANRSLIPLGIKVSTCIRGSPLRAVMRDDWGALGYSTDSVERASGQHNKNLLVIVDEASGLEPEIYEALDSLKAIRMMLNGNPIRPDGPFVDAIRRGEKDKLEGIPPEIATNSIHISSLESPDAHSAKSEWGLADKTWLDKMARQYGVDSLWWRCHILALVPELAADQLIPPAWLDRASKIPHPPLRPFDAINATRRIGVDLGEGVGRDSTCIVVVDRFGILEIEAGASLGLAEAADRVSKLAGKWGIPSERISYDRAGIGRDFRHYLIRHGLDDCVGYSGAGRAKNPREFVNLRTEAAWKLRQRLNPDWSSDPRWPRATEQPGFSIPQGPHWPAMREELEKLTYDLIGKQIRLITKEDLCIELGRSPDRSDALIQTFAFGA
jgi:hypothetical protein